ncbi:MAG: hypothetical protein RLZ98_3630 [Pseudomonadota bacterium]|jgi:cytoskeletal protein CcmA (bactofilin family)
MLPNFKKAEKPATTTTGTSSTPPPLSTPAPAMPAVAPAAAPRAAPKSGDRRTVSVIGPDLTIMGNLVSQGEVQVDGEIQGDLHGTHILIGENARITGGVIGEEIVIRGHVMGSVRGKNVMLQATSHVEGDVFHQTLGIEQGAYFEGKSRRSEDPTSGVPRPELPSQKATG